MMGYYRHNPPPPLDQYVDHFWMLDQFPAEAAERLFPDGTVELIFNMGSTQRLFDRDNPRQFTPFRHSWLAGPRRQSIVIGSSGLASLVGIHFRPYGAYPFLQIPMSELAEQVLSLELMWGADATLLRDRLGMANCPAERFRILSRELVQRLRPDSRGEADVRQLIDRCASSSQAIVSADRTLRRRFDELVGLSPKTMQRLLRFQRIIQRIECGNTLDWTSLAVAEGLYDQSHLVREFREFAGMTPGQYLARKGPYPNAVPES